MIAFVWNDLVKSTVLGAMVVATLACAAWRVGGALNGAPAARPSQVVAIDDGRAEAKAPVAKVAAFDPDADRAESTVADPFVPLVPDPATAPTLAEPTKGAVPATLSGPLAPIVVEGPKGAGKAAEAPQAAPGATNPAGPAMRLTGVVVGANPTAIVMVGGDELVVRPGGRLPDGSILVKIDRESVTLARNGAKSVLWVAD